MGTELICMDAGTLYQKNLDRLSSAWVNDMAAMYLPDVPGPWLDRTNLNTLWNSIVMD